MNPTDASIVKNDIDKLLAVGFVELVDNSTWLSSIMVIPKKIGGFKHSKMTTKCTFATDIIIIKLWDCPLAQFLTISTQNHNTGNWGCKMSLFSNKEKLELRNICNKSL